jgi:hypothetical protein
MARVEGNRQLINGLGHRHLRRRWRSTRRRRWRSTRRRTTRRSTRRGWQGSPLPVVVRLGVLFLSSIESLVARSHHTLEVTDTS